MVVRGSSLRMGALLGVGRRPAPWRARSNREDVVDNRNTEERVSKRGALAGSTLIPAVVAIVAAAALVAAFFLPFGSANDEYRQTLASVPDEWVDEAVGITASDAMDMSLFEYAKVYGNYSAQVPGAGWEIIVGIIIAVGVLSALTLLFAAARKATPTAVFAILTFGVAQLLIGSFAESGIVPSSAYDVGIAHALYTAAPVIAVVASVWLFVVKFKAKRAVL